MVALVVVVVQLCYVGWLWKVDLVFEKFNFGSYHKVRMSYLQEKGRVAGRWRASHWQRL